MVTSSPKPSRHSSALPAGVLPRTSICGRCWGWWECGWVTPRLLFIRLQPMRKHPCWTPAGEYYAWLYNFCMSALPCHCQESKTATADFDRPIMHCIRHDETGTAALLEHVCHLQERSQTSCSSFGKFASLACFPSRNDNSVKRQFYSAFGTHKLYSCQGNTTMVRITYLHQNQFCT